MLAMSLCLLQLANLYFLYGFYVAGRFHAFCENDKNVAAAKRLGRIEKNLVTRAAAADRAGIRGFLLSAHLALKFSILRSLMDRVSASTSVCHSGHGPNTQNSN